MTISGVTLDDLLKRVYERLLKTTDRATPTRGEIREIVGIMLKLRKPRARLSRTEIKGKLFSCIGELLWYLSKTNRLAFIKYYLSRYAEDSEDGKTIYGAYGPRLFNMRGTCDQVENVLELLRRKPNSRRAVIQLFNAEDIIGNRKEVPCTCTLQFLRRQNRLHLVVYMRSNDAFLGLPHDIFAFTMLQELFARSLGIEIGTYSHAVGSLHIYEPHISKARRFINEGWQSTVEMPSMPEGDPWPSVSRLLKLEAQIRKGSKTRLRDLGLDPYWADFVRLLQIFRYGKSASRKRIGELRFAMSTRIYDSYIRNQESARTTPKTTPGRNPTQVEGKAKRTDHG